MSVVGASVAQSLTINRVQHALPAFPIFTESRESLKELQITTFAKFCLLRQVTNT